jgi:histidinol-phosphate aminotransferase
MNPMLLSRRRFAGSIGAALGASLLAPLRAVARPAPIAASVPAATPAAPQAGQGGIRLDSNENPYGPSARALAAMAASPMLASRYPDSGEEPLIATLARLHATQEENVVLGCGSGEIIKMADMAFLTAGQRLIVAEPTFEAVVVFSGLTRAVPVKVPLTADFRHDLKAMAAACDGEAGMVYICNPNNPTGTIVGRAALQACLEAIPSRVVVLIDEAYHHFVEDPSYASAVDLIARFPNLIVSRTFSKIYGLAGMRLGYAVAAKERIDAMRRHAVWSNANAAVLAAARASLDDADHVPRQRRQMNDTRRFLCAELEKDGRRVIPSEANFVMFEVGKDVREVIAALAARQIFVGRRFAALPQWLRVSIGTRTEIEAFLAALRQVVPAPAKS